MIIGNRFELKNKINSGSFGQIHLAIDIKTKQVVAVKMQTISAKHPQLQYQAKLLAYLTDQIDPRQKGLPRIHFYGKFDNKYNVMIMDLLGPSLEELFQRCNKKFDLKTVVMIGIQIIDRLKYLHKKKFIHRDIKPQNFLLGMNQHCDKVFMIDLGLSKKYIQKNGQHLPYRDDRSLKGTPRYTSLNSHLGIEQSRRDDLQSVVYMLIYFLKGQLPWQNLKQDANYDRYQKILEKKLSVSVQNLCLGIPPQFKQLVEYTRGLHFIEQPNYQQIKNLLVKALTNAGSQVYDNDLYCWEKVQGQEEVQVQNFKKTVSKESQIKQSSNKDSLFSKEDTSNKFSPFDSGFQAQPSYQQKQKNRQDSMEFNPFDTSIHKKTQEDDIFGHFGQKRDSLDKSEDNPFKGTKTQRSGFQDDPFSNGFDDLQNKNRQSTGKNQSFDDPFGDSKDPDIVEY